MRLLLYKGLDLRRVKPAFEKIKAAIEADDFRSADVKKLNAGPYYRARLDYANRLLLQFARVEQRGESALMFFDGSFSHAIRKGPLLRAGGGDVTGLFATEDISARRASADELVVGARAVVAIPGGAPLYARVDLIESDNGTPQILELELTEPSLFFAQGVGSAERFAAAVCRRLGTC